MRSQSQAQAVRWYRTSAEKGDPESMYNLGVCYEEGDGCHQDPAAAFGWYRKAAERGYARAQNSLGLCYQYGFGVDSDELEAERRFFFY